MLIASSVRPAPISPAMPTISPRADVEVGVVDDEPFLRCGCWTVQSSIRSTSSPRVRGARGSGVQVAADHAADDAVSVTTGAPCRGSRSVLPSRMIVVESAIALISFSLCEMMMR